MKGFKKFFSAFLIFNMGTAFAASDTLSFSITVTTNLPDWCNFQWPDGGEALLGEDFTVYAQVYEPGITDAQGQGSGMYAQFGISTTNTNPSEEGWNWFDAIYNTDVSNNDEYMLNLKDLISETGVYYVVSRFSLDSTNWAYGGYNAGGGGFWDGTTNVSIQITVQRGNDAPVLNVLPHLAITEDVPYQLILRATDPDDDPVSFACWGGSQETVLPSLSRDSILTLTPAQDFFTLPGDTIDIYVRAFDPYLGADTALIKVTVIPVNDPPIILFALTDTTVYEEETLSFTLTANDVDDEILIWSAENLPEGAEFIDNSDKTASFTWTPTIGQAGSYENILFIVSDEEGSKAVVRITPPRGRPGAQR
ncbi:MAG: Ig-like domain-containing protein [Candidatus Marinimicrobia bacterium]|nr:Ig-like domain-containing protein [Candidatus Neomarinimicrobiota bacterium]